MDALEFINIYQPEHCRDSCSDDDVNNGFYSRCYPAGHGRCTRCMMLEIIAGHPIPIDLGPDDLRG